MKTVYLKPYILVPSFALTTRENRPRTPLKTTNDENPPKKVVVYGEEFFPIF